ncbi:amidohydrolase [candidate division KSB1 bacterium]
MNLTGLKTAVLCVFLVIIIGCAGEPEYNGPPADMVIRNAKIVTIDSENPRAEAIAFKGEEIIGVTSNRAIDQYISDNTEVIDAEGRLVIPGLNDAHAHFSGSSLMNLDFRYMSDIKEIQRLVAEAVSNAKPGELIQGRGWDHENFPDKQWPTKEILDEVAPDNPVALSRADGHSVWVNSYVIRQSGITKDTESPPGGSFIKDPVTGEPTGIFKEAASRLLRTRGTVQLTEAEREERADRSMELILDHARKLGVTSVSHLNGNEARFKKFYDEGRLPVRITFNISLPRTEEGLQRIAALREQYPMSDNWVRFGYLKGFIDGTLGSGTALMFEPFEDDPSTSGLPQMPYEELERRIVAADALGFQVGIHAIGTKANNWILNAYEKAQQVNGIRDSRHRSEHAQILIMSDIPRFAELGVIASMQPTHCITDKRFAEKRIGVERCEGAYAWQKLLDAGVHIAFGTDFSVEPLDPLEGLYGAVTRKDRNGEPGDGWFPDQRLSMEKAIELYTLGAAYAEFMEDRKGMLKIGYLADVTIYNEDLMTIPHEEIMDAKVDFTIVGGKVVYKRDGSQ